MVGPIVHPHHNVDPTSRRSGKLTSSTVSATLPMGLTMLPESPCPLTILMMLIVFWRRLLLSRILFKPAMRTT
jgi:ABC-type nickel/cobalt efflux system permease component RcnA